MKRCPVLVPCALLATGLVGCGGSDGGSSSSDGRISGTLIVPASTEDTAALLNATRDIPRLLRVGGDCPDVPVGYRPLGGAQISFTGSDGVALSDTFQSDDCGAFAATPPDGATGLRAISDGFRPILTDVATFSDGEGARLASTIRTDATYRIDALQVLDDGLAFVVSDSATRQAVLGLPASAFNVALDGANLPVDSLGLAASANENASVVLALDASGSMNARVRTETDERLTRNQTAALAAHVFLDQKAAGDEVATSLFSSQVYFIDQAQFDERVAPVDADGNPVGYVLSEDGFVTDPARMRLVIDAYNRSSALYSAPGDPSGDARHPDTPADVFIDRYRFSGSTAFYDAVGDGVDRLEARSTPRPVIVAMTDGRNNASMLDLDGTIDKAQRADVPVYTVGFEAPAEADVLGRLAAETGGSYFQADGEGIGTVYQSIQTGIVFQYVARFDGVDLNAGTMLRLSLDYDGLQVDRELTLTR